MKYRIFNILTVMLALGGLLAGCAVAQEENVGGQDSREIRFRAQVGAFQVKATDTAFEAGDELGIFAWSIGAYNVKASVSPEGIISPSEPLYWDPSLGAQDYMGFSAYYPYNPDYDYSTWVRFTVRPDQSTREGYMASDFMFARTDSRPMDQEVVFNFRHAMAKLVISVENKLADTEIDQVFLSGVYGWVGRDLLEDAWSTTGTPGTIKTGKGTTPEGQDAWVCIVPPQDVKPEILITTTDGREFRTHPDEFISFYSGSRSKARIVLDENLVSTEFSQEVTEWVDDSDFQFGWPPEWSIIGTVYGSNWDNDYVMNASGNIWSITIPYRVGQEFKFRKNYDWTENLGGLEYKANWTLTDDGVYTADLKQDGYNLILPEDGYWSIVLDVKACRAFATKVSDFGDGRAISIDGDFSDWDRLDPAFVAVARGDEDARHVALTLAKVYADQDYVYVYFEYDTELIYHEPDVEHVPFHCFINTDGDTRTGGFSDMFSDACSDIVLEGFIYPGGANIGSYDPSVYPWVGEPNGAGWGWGEEILPNGNGLCQGAGVEGKYELRIDRNLLGSIGYPVADIFSIGFDIEQFWSSVGVLPEVAPSEDNPSGVAGSLWVTSTYVQPYPDVVYANSIDEVLNGQDGLVYSVSAPVSHILNMTYGNFYMEDSTGQLYIYGTVNAQGLYPKDADANGWFTEEFGLVPGDVVTVRGVRKTYNNTVELVDVQLEKVKRRVLGVPWDGYGLDYPAGSISMMVRSLDDTVNVDIPVDWVRCDRNSLVSDHWCSLVFSLDENVQSEKRSTEVVLYNETCAIYVFIEQNGAPDSPISLQEATLVEDDTWISLHEIVYEVNSRGFTLFDGKYSLFVYCAGDPKVNVGDEVELKGLKTTYNGLPELTKPTWNILSTGNELYEPYYEEVTPEMMSSLLAGFNLPIRVKGQLSVSGTKFNVSVPGANSYFQIYWPYDYWNLASYDGLNVELTGFYLGLYNDRHSIAINGIHLLSEPDGTAN